MATAEMDYVNRGGGGIKIYRYNGNKSGLTNKITCTDMTTGETFQPKAIMFGGKYSTVFLTVQWTELEPTKEYYIYDTSASVQDPLSRIASIDSDGFTINSTNFNNYSNLEILAIG